MLSAPLTHTVHSYGSPEQMDGSVSVFTMGLARLNSPTRAAVAEEAGFKRDGSQAP